ncbi:MAG: glycosyltransferase, partial [Gemmatimonadota bacterium]
MKIALIIPDGVDRSGAGRVLPCLIAQIRRIAEEHELHVFALRQEPRPSRYDLFGAHVHNIGGRRLFRRRRTAAAIRREHRRAPFDALHAIGVESGVVAVRAGRRPRRGVLLHITDDDLADAGVIDRDRRVTGRDRRRLERTAERADRVTVSSDWLRERVQRLEIEAERVTPGVDLERWPARPPRRRPSDRPARLLHVADLSPHKDQHTLLRAAARLA